MIEEILGFLLSVRGALGILALCTVVFYVKKIHNSREIAKLGARSPQIPAKLPAAADFIVKSIKARNEHRDVQFWMDALDDAARNAGVQGPGHTAELNSLASQRILMTNDPENIKALLTGQFADFGKGEPFHKEWYEFLGDSIFATDGEMWSASRHLIRPMFVRDRLVDMEIFEKHVQKLIPHLAGSTPQGGRVVDVGPLFFRYTLDAATEYLLGKGTDSLDDPSTEFAEAFRFVQAKQSEIFRMGPLSFLISRKEFRKQLKKMDDYIQPYIQTVLSLTSEELDKKGSKQESFLDALARFTRDPRVLRDQLVAVLLAGRDTTAGTLSFTFFELARHPEVVTKLREEIASHLGLGAQGRKPTYEDLKEMKYLTAVINETLRYYPVVPFNVRYSLKDTTLPRGGGPDGLAPVGVRKDTRIMYSTMIMQRRPDHYTDDNGHPLHPRSMPATEKAPVQYHPGKWIPDRWMSGWQPKPWQFIPFNGGPRICIGQQFAMLEMGYTIARIFQSFESVYAMPRTGLDTVDAEPVMQFEVTLSPGAEFNMVFVRDGEK